MMIQACRNCIRQQGDDLTYKKQKKHVLGFFLASGSLLIFLSLFLVWATVTHFGYRDITYEYGYDRPLLYIIFFISLIPLLILEFEIKFTKKYLFIPFTEFLMFWAVLPMHYFVYSVEIGIGMLVAGLGILFQFIGIIIAVVFESLDKMVAFNQPPNQVILRNYHR